MRGRSNRAVERASGSLLPSASPATLKGPSFRHAPVTTGHAGNRQLCRSPSHSETASQSAVQPPDQKQPRRPSGWPGAVPSRPESGSAALRDVSDGIANGLKSSGMSAPEIFCARRCDRWRRIPGGRQATTECCKRIRHKAGWHVTDGRHGLRRGRWRTDTDQQVGKDHHPRWVRARGRRNQTCKGLPPAIKYDVGGATCWGTERRREHRHWRRRGRKTNAAGDAAGR